MDGCKAARRHRDFPARTSPGHARAEDAVAVGFAERPSNGTSTAIETGRIEAIDTNDALPRSTAGTAGNY